MLARFRAKWQHSSLLDAPEGQLQHRARSTKKLRPRLTALAAILAHFHPLLWLAEALRFNTLIRQMTLIVIVQSFLDHLPLVQLTARIDPVE